MLGPAIVIYLGLTPGPWMEWIVSLAFAVAGTLVLRHLIWLSWPTLRKIEAFKKAGWHLDAIILSTLLLSFSNNIPAPIYGNPLFTYFLKLFFILLVFRHIYAIGSLCFESKTLFPNWPSALRQRWKNVLGIFVVVWALTLYGTEYLPVAFLSSWSFFIILISVNVALFPVSRDIVLGWSLLQSLHLEIGQTVKIQTEKELISGTITDLKWTHLVLRSETNPSEQVRVPWSEVYPGKIT